MKGSSSVWFLIITIVIFFISRVDAGSPNVTMTSFIRKEGYACEEHTVQTEDGYLLTVFRIPGRKGAPTVFLQHGFLMSSFDWIVLGKEKALAFMLADNGYDVWMGNARGNRYSNRHVSYNTSQHEFWNFSWHEMGIYDLPAVITYITDMKNDSLTYVGHSMGGTMFFVMAIEKPQIARKVRAMFGLAPMSYAHHFQSPVKNLAPYANLIEDLTNLLNIHSLFDNDVAQGIRKHVCQEYTSKNNNCLKLSFFLGGYDVAEELIPNIYTHFPAGASVKTVIHFLQEINTGKFQYYDYRSAKNKQLYNNSKPPLYDLTKVNVPVGMFSSLNDLFVSLKDAQLLYELLPNKIFHHTIEYEKFSHFDHLWALYGKDMLYTKLLSEMQAYKTSANVDVC